MATELERFVQASILCKNQHEKLTWVTHSSLDFHLTLTVMKDGKEEKGTEIGFTVAEPE